MAVPTIEKTWQFDVNQIIGVPLTTIAGSRATLLAIKNSLLEGCLAGGGGAAPWTVRYSCNSATAGVAGDGVDRWTIGDDLQWEAAGVAHSWIVLQQNGIATGWQLLLSLENATANGTHMGAWFSPSAGFTGGTTTARPTATDEAVILAPHTVWNQVGTAARRVHCMQSSDGQVTRIFVCHDSITEIYWEFAKAKNPRASWTVKSYAVMIEGAGGVVSNYTSLFGQPRAVIRHNVTTGAAYFTSEATSGGALGQVQVSADDYDAAFPMAPIGLYSTTAGTRGRIGQVFDMWWGSTAVAEGDSYDELGSKAFAQLGDVIVPSGGVTLQVA